MKSLYINPFTDFGFKKLFGEEASKDLLIDFLNALLPDVSIADLSFRDKAKLGRTEEYRSSVFDLYCEGANGERFIVEMQKAKQNYFRDRVVYYSTFPIQEQAQRGEWDYSLQSVYCIGILDFVFKENLREGFPAETVQTVQLKDQDNQVFYQKLRFVFVEMPRFTKGLDELEGRLDQWLYFIKHLEYFESIPAIFRDSVFEKALHRAEIAKYDRQQLDAYDESLKRYRDLKNSIDTSFFEGKALGKAEGIEEERERGRREKEEEVQRMKKKMEEEIGQKNREVAKSLKDNNVPLSIISSSTGLSLEEIAKL